MKKILLSSGVVVGLGLLVACSDSDVESDTKTESSSQGNVNADASTNQELKFSETVEGKAVLKAKAEAESAAEKFLAQRSLKSQKEQVDDKKEVVVAKYVSTTEGDYPRLVLTQQDVEFIKSEGAKSETFSNALKSLQDEIDLAIASPIDVPVPKDAGGSYTHEQHKRNYKAIYGAGVLYQLTGEDKYLQHAKTLFMAYVELYPTLGEHPEKKLSLIHI